MPFARTKYKSEAYGIIYIYIYNTTTFWLFQQIQCLHFCAKLSLDNLLDEFFYLFMIFDDYSNQLH